MKKLTIYTSGGAPVADGASLAAGTYYALCTPFDYEQWSQGSLEYKHDATAAFTLTVERTNQPELTIASAGWRQISTALMAAIVVAGGSTGGDIVDLVENNAARQRVVLVVGTAGVVDLWDHHKEG